MKVFFLVMAAVMVVFFFVNGFHHEDKAGRDCLLFAILNLILYRIW